MWGESERSSVPMIHQGASSSSANHNQDRWVANSIFKSNYHAIVYMYSIFTHKAFEPSQTLVVPETRAVNVSKINNHIETRRPNGILNYLRI